MNVNTVAVQEATHLQAVQAMALACATYKNPKRVYVTCGKGANLMRCFTVTTGNGRVVLATMTIGRKPKTVYITMSRKLARLCVDTTA